MGPVLFLVREALSTPSAAMPLLGATFDPVLPQQLSGRSLLGVEHFATDIALQRVPPIRVHFDVD